MVSSFNPFSVRRFRHIAADAIPTAVIYSNEPDVPIGFRRGAGRFIAGCPFLKPRHTDLDARTVDRLQTQKGLPIIVWTVNSREDYERMLALGVKGIISNNPHLFLQPED